MNLNTILQRLRGMKPELVAKVDRMVKDGYGAHGITLESDATLKQANAVFAARKHAHSAAELMAREA